MKWSEFVITYDQRNILDNYVHLGHFPIMVSPFISNARVYRVLMDEGSSLNIIYTIDLDAMQVLRSMIKLIHKPFYGAGSSMVTQSMGQVKLPMTIGTLENFCTEKITFNVVYFDMA